MQEAKSAGLAAVIQQGADQLMPDVLGSTWPGMSWDEVRGEIAQEQSTILAGNPVPPTDAQSEGLASVSAYMLAMYRVLWRRAGDRLKAIDVCRQVATTAFRGGVMDHIARRFKVDFDKPEEAFDRIAENFLSGGAEVFGERFLYEQEALTSQLNSVKIRRCYFNDFLRGNGAPELIPVFCACDNIWADEINKAKYGVSFHRPSLLSLGDDACRFQFRRR